MQNWQRNSILEKTIIGGMIAALLAIGVATSAVAQNGTPFAFPPPADAAEALRLSHYTYDRALPLNPALKPLDTTAARARFHLTCDSVHDQQVTAILSVPKRYVGPYPAIVLMHGSGGDKDVDYIRAASETLVKQGYMTLSMDAQYRGERVRPGKDGDLRPDQYTMRDAWIQTVIDLRRMVDYLESRPDIDKSKIGFLGFSLGGMMGSVLGGVEPRLAAFCLAVPGGGIVNLAKNIDRYPLLKSRWPLQVTPEVLKTVEDIASVIDPIYFVGRILPRPLLIIVAKKDEVIPAEASQALITAAHAREPENIKRWDAGHALHPNVAFDIRDFFVAHFGKRTPR